MKNWKTIKESKKYKVNKLGEVLGPSGKTLKPIKTKTGYATIAISLGNRIVKRQYVHILVAETFIGKIPNEYVVNHKDGNKENNKLENLEIVTRSENAKQWAVKNKKDFKKDRSYKKPKSDICWRGHKREENRNYSYCSTCKAIKEKGLTYNPPSDTIWKKSLVEHYLVSQDGRVWSIKSQRLMKNVKNLTGYHISCLTVNGKPTRFNVHKLVVDAFIGKVKCSDVIDHIDGNRENNNVKNLRIVTQSDNLKFARKRMIENGNHGFKLCEKDVIEIKLLLKNKSLSERKIAEKYSVGKSLINDIKLGYKWKHVQNK